MWRVAFCNVYVNIQLNCVLNNTRNMFNALRRRRHLFLFFNNNFPVNYYRKRLVNSRFSLFRQRCVILFLLVLTAANESDGNYSLAMRWNSTEFSNFFKALWLYLFLWIFVYIFAGKCIDWRNIRQIKIQNDNMY